MKCYERPIGHEKKLIRLKTDPEYFDDVWSGKKRFEVRRNDRDFLVGDELLLCSTAEEQRVIRALITYKLDGGQFGIEPGFCVLQIRVVGRAE